MSGKLPPAVRTFPLIGLALVTLAAPLVGTEQRFGGAGRPAVVPVAAPQPPAPQQAQAGQSRPPGQRGGGPGRDLFYTEWWNNEEVRKELTLTPRQIGSITRYYENRVRQMKPLDDEMRKQLDELERMTRERTVDVNTYLVQVTRVEALRTELFKTRAVMLYSIYRELTPEQYQKLREIRDRRRSGRGAGPR